MKRKDMYEEERETLLILLGVQLLKALRLPYSSPHTAKPSFTNFAVYKPVFNSQWSELEGGVAFY